MNEGQGRGGGESVDRWVSRKTNFAFIASQGVCGGEGGWRVEGEGERGWRVREKLSMKK